MGELVGVVAQARHLAQQVGVVGAGLRLHLGPGDERPQVFLTRQAAGFGLPREVLQLPLRQPDGDHPAAPAPAQRSGSDWSGAARLASALRIYC